MRRFTSNGGGSKHYRANVGCYECHMSQEGKPGAAQHEGQWITTIVSPRDCGRCHSKEVEEFANSHHSKAARILGSLDNTLAEIVEGNRGMITPAFPRGVSSAAVSGCWQCHGTGDQSLARRQTRSGDLAQHGHWPHQSRRLRRLMLRLPQPAFLFGGPGPASRQLRQVPHGA